MVWSGMECYKCEPKISHWTSEWLETKYSYSTNQLRFNKFRDFRGFANISCTRIVHRVHSPDQSYKNRCNSLKMVRFSIRNYQKFTKFSCTRIAYIWPIFAKFSCRENFMFSSIILQQVFNCSCK